MKAVLTTVLFLTTIANSTAKPFVDTAKTLKTVEQTQQQWLPIGESVPDLLKGKWVLDTEATEQLIKQKVSSEDLLYKFLPKLLKLNGELVKEFTQDKFIISNGEKQMSYDVKLTQKTEEALYFDISRLGSGDQLTVRSLSNDSIQILNPQLLGSQLFVWKKQI